MESSDPSVERRRREYISSSFSVPLSIGSSRSLSDLINLSSFIKLMGQAEIDGPYQMWEIHLGGKHLGTGAQFDVYGHRHAAIVNVLKFDEPYTQTRKVGNFIRPVIVAMKRPRFNLAISDYGSSLSMGFGTPSQLHSLQLEVLALCHETIRNHRNIVKLLAWGFECSGSCIKQDKDQKVEPIKPILIMEHGNCSLRDFLANDEGLIPGQVLQNLALDVAQGLSALHACGIIHGDIKTDNVLVFPDEKGPFFCVAKLSDFGLSVFDQTERVFNIGTPGWQAPEIPSDDGIGTEMLVKCDCFSLGLLIFSVIFTKGAPPLQNLSSGIALELIRDNLARSKIPSPTSDRIYCVLECLLRPDPFERVSDLENVCRLLGELEDEPFDRDRSWINGRFDDNTPWSSLYPPDLVYNLVLGTQTEYGYHKNGLRSEDVISFYSWQEIERFLHEHRDKELSFIPAYYIDGIDNVVSSRTPEENLTMETVGPEITGYQLMALCFIEKSHRDSFGEYDNNKSPRVSRRLRGTGIAVAAEKGYFPAQAIALQLLEGTGSKLLKKVHLNGTQWQWNAVSTGYVLAWKFAYEYPKEHTLALDSFRKSGGYNTHYIYTESKANFNYDTSGLLHNPLEWLSGYPLHHAAVLGDILEVERLLKDIDVNSLDISGETPLQRACMAGACSSVRLLVSRGADLTSKSKSLGTVPLHWLFVFQPEEVFDIAALLTTKDKSVLSELSAPDAEAFHFPFKWPTGTPLEWAVLSNRSEAVTALLRLGSTLDSIADFFPGPPNWAKDIHGVASDSRMFVHDSFRKLSRAWVYYSMRQYRLSVVQNNPDYQKQLEPLTSESGQQDLPISGSDLNTAVIENDLDTAKKLIDMGVDINYVITGRSNRATALGTATERKNLNMVKLLLDSGAQFDGDYPGDVRPLRIAAHRQNLEIIKMLLDKGADVNARSGGKGLMGLNGNPYYLGTAIYDAAEATSTEAIKLLLQHGADPNPQAEGEMNALEAAANRNSLEIVNMLLEKGANPNTLGINTFYRKNALQEATWLKNTGMLCALLDAGADPNTQGNSCALFEAALDIGPDSTVREREDVIRLLLERGADVATSGGHYGSVMQAVACTGSDFVAKLLLNAGAPVSIGGGPHGSALQAAVWAGNLKLIQLLLDHGADPDFGGDDKWETPLQLAVHREDEEQVDILLRRGADPNTQGGLCGNTFRIAERSGNVKIIQMLLAWGAQDESEPDRWKSMLEQISTPLSHSDVTCVRSLLERCLERSTQKLSGGSTLVDLVNKIINFAGYLLADLSQRHDGVEVSEDTDDIPYLQVRIKDWPSPTTNVRQIIFRIKSQDTTSKIPGLHGDDPYQNSHIWFEARISSNTIDQSKPCITIQKHLGGSLATRTYNITYDLNSNEPQISKFLHSLKPGDFVEIYAKAGPGKHVYVNSIEVVVFYGQTKAPTFQRPITEALREESEPTPTKTELSPPETSGTTKKLPHRTQTDTNSTLTETLDPHKKSGFPRNLIEFFIKCFK